jgi:hypothetical protein
LFAVCFKIFDQDKDALLSRTELEKMVAVMKFVLVENLADNPKDDVIAVLTREDVFIVDDILKCATSIGGLTLEEYLVWSLSNPLPEVFLTLIYQVIDCKNYFCFVLLKHLS